MERETMMYGGRELTVVGRVSRSLECDLTTSELIDLTSQFAHKCAEIERVEGEKKAAMDEFKRELNELETARSSCAKKVSTRVEERMTQCVTLIDLDRCQELVIRLDTREMVEDRTLGPKEIARRTQSTLELGEERSVGAPIPAAMEACGCGLEMPPGDFTDGSTYECEHCGRAYVWSETRGGWFYQDGCDKRTRCICGEALPTVPEGASGGGECDACGRAWVVKDGAWELQESPPDETPEPTESLCVTCATSCQHPPEDGDTVLKCGDFVSVNEQKPSCGSCERWQPEGGCDAGNDPEGPDDTCVAWEHTDVRVTKPGERDEEPEPDGPCLPEEFGARPVMEATSAQCAMYLQSLGQPIPTGKGQLKRRREFATKLINLGVLTDADVEEHSEKIEQLYDDFGPYAE